jgi:hypothetical protein
MSKDDGIVMLPPAEQFISQIERLVRIQALAGNDVQPLYSQNTDAGIYRAGCVIPKFGQFSIMGSIYGSDYSVIDCIVFDDAVPFGWSSNEARFLTVSRLSKDASWIQHEESSEIVSSDIERLTAFVSESPQEVFERLFALWFYDYSGIVPDDFTLEKIESIYNQSSALWTANKS